MVEEWREVPGAPGYRVSNLGRVVGRMGFLMTMQPGRKDKDRPRFPARIGGRTRKLNLHQVVCEAFHGPKPSPLHQVLHWDDNPTNNRADNLRWGTQAQNHEDRRRNGTKIGPRPEAATGAKMTWELVRQIRTRYASGEKQCDLAVAYGIGRPQLNAIVHRRCWKDDNA